MKQQTKIIAICSMMTALGVVILLLGAALGLGIYLCPVIVGLCLMPVGKAYGTTYQLVLWVAISLLSFLLVPDPEENLLFAGLFGWYPALYPRLQKLPKLPRLVIKLLLFNGIVLALEALLVLVLVPEAIGSAMIVVLLLLGNLMFLLYDKAIPIFERVTAKHFARIFGK